MTSRHQRILFWTLAVCSLALALLLLVTRQRTRNRVENLTDNVPLDAPATDALPTVLDLANDADGSVTENTRPLALPSEETARARALIDHLIAEYALPGSDHPLPPGTAVNEVFLLPLPVVGHTTLGAQASPNTPLTLGANAAPVPTVLVPNTDPNALKPQSPGGELAVIDLRGSFVNTHPAGVETESLTLLSIIGTLHANLPQIEQIRFLVDGQPRETLAGNADLQRTYPSRDTTVPPAAPVAP